MTALATLRAVDAVTTDAALRLAVLRLTGEMELYRNLWKAAFHAGCAAYDRIAVVERQLQDSRDELRRITSRACA